MWEIKFLLKSKDAKKFDVTNVLPTPVSPKIRTCLPLWDKDLIICENFKVSDVDTNILL